VASAALRRGRHAIGLSGPVRGVRSALSGGPRAIVMRALGRTVYRRVEWMERPLQPVLPPIHALVTVSHGFLDGADAAEIAGLRPPTGDNGIAGRFARGDRCFGTRHDGRLVSLTWISMDVARIEYLGLAYVLPPGTAFQYERWTDPRLRGRRIAPASGSRLCRELASEGYALLVGCVLRENEAAMANALRAGFRSTGTIGWVRVGPLRRPFRRRRAVSTPRAGAGTTARAAAAQCAASRPA
jgi:hypothetical protein